MVSNICTYSTHTYCTSHLMPWHSIFSFFICPIDSCRRHPWEGYPSVRRNRQGHPRVQIDYRRWVQILPTAGVDSRSHLSIPCQSNRYSPPFPASITAQINPPPLLLQLNKTPIRASAHAFLCGCTFPQRGNSLSPFPFQARTGKEDLLIYIWNSIVHLYVYW